jgi:hypothetical protein
MRATLITLAALAALLSACKGSAKPAPTGVPAQPDAAAAAWLDPQAQIGSAIRLVTPAGEDLRQALYFRAGVRLLVLTRDYSQRTEGIADPQRLALVPTGPGEPQALDPGADYLPLKLCATPGHTAFCLSAIKRAAGVRLDDAPLHILLFQPDGTFRVLDKAPSVSPLGFISERLLLCRPVARRERAGGLIVLGLDWQARALAGDIQTGAFRPTDGVACVANADGSRIAGYALHYDPALPAQAVIEYIESGKGGSHGRWSLPYHVSYETALWEPPLAFASASRLATVTFRPDATGRGERANERGLFRLVTLDAVDGQARLVEDRVHPYMTLAAGGGLVFYTLRLYAAGQPVWELWAATTDGLNKQRLWQEKDAEYIAIEDLLDARRLLVLRQYAAYRGAEPELHSELRELSLDPLEQSTIAIPEGTPAPAEAPAANDADLFSSGKPQGGGGAAGNLPLPAPGEGGTPPPIAVP